MTLGELVAFDDVISELAVLKKHLARLIDQRMLTKCEHRGGGQKY